MSRLIAITGISAIGKKKLAFKLADELNASIVCGDKVQMLAGCENISGAVERLKYSSGSYLYGSTPCRSNATGSSPLMSPDRWFDLCKAIIKHGGTYVIDGLAFYYMHKAVSLNARVFRLNFSGDWRELLIRNINEKITDDLLQEVAEYQDNQSLLSESAVAKFISGYTKGVCSLNEAKEQYVDYMISRMQGKVKNTDIYSDYIKDIVHDINDIDSSLNAILNSI